MTGEQYWNARGRGFGGEPDGENTTSCAEENLLGYPGTRYFGSSICVHEFSHGIMRGAIYTVDPDYRKAVEDAYAAAKKQGLSSAQGYPGNNFNEYWATGIEAYVFGSGRGPRHAARGRSAAVRAGPAGDPVDEDARQRLRRTHAAGDLHHPSSSIASMAATPSRVSVSRIRSSPQITWPSNSCWISWTICSRTPGRSICAQQVRQHQRLHARAAARSRRCPGDCRTPRGSSASARCR